MEVSGFYGPSPNPNVLSVYLTKNVPLKKGMIVRGLSGIPGTAIVTDFASNVYGDVVINPGPPAISFPYVDVASVQIIGGGTLPVQPSSLLQLTFELAPEQKSQAHVFRGPLVTGNVFQVYVLDAFTGPVPEKGWSIKGLSDPATGILDVSGNVVVTSDVIFGLGTSNILKESQITPQEYVYTFTAQVEQAQVLPNPGSNVLATFLPPTAKLEPAFYSLYDPKIFDASAIKGQPAELRDLGSNVESVYIRDPMVQLKGQTGALTALAAIGPQEKLLYGGESYWTPQITQHTPFAITQRYIPLIAPQGCLGKTVQVDIFPRENGDLISNMYLKCSLPAGTYTEMVGRALINKVEFLINGQVIESLTDDWYIIHDQLYLDADERLGLYQLVSNGTPEGSDVVCQSPGQIDLMIPLDFFFCHRFTHKRMRDKPFFPMCAIGFQTVSVRFTFNSQAWITPQTSTIDLINPQLLLEEVWLSPGERMYYMKTPIDLKIQRVWKESTQTFQNGVARINFTANFPASVIVWFIRNKKYEQQSSAYYSSRYTYGYTTKYILATVPVNFFNGTTLNYIDTIDYATIFLNNQNVLSNFPGALYYTFKQALDHGFTIPNKSMYMYSFSEIPRYRAESGTFDFSKVDSRSSFIDIKFLEQYAAQIQSEFSLNLYYYGFATLHIENGLCTLR